MGRDWYPGVDNLGEGIFIMLDLEDGWHYNISTSYTDEWNGAVENRLSYPQDINIFRGDNREELDPVFVWWHTLSHLLIRSLSIEAGYSSAAIRERVYFERDRTGRKRGAILLYATQPGSEGTLVSLHWFLISDRS